jgi:hypothetical protein
MVGDNMELHIMDNGINSLKVGLDFYNKFLDNLNSLDISVDHYGNLKFSVIAIHNSIELFTKKILSDINEFLIFKVDIESDEAVCRMLHNQYIKGRKKAGLSYHATFRENDYKTIDYNKCISLINKIFKENITNRQYKTLDKLAQYRNTLTHLGYTSVYEWYKILITLNDTLYIIKEFYVKNILNADRYFDDSIMNIMDKTLEKAKKETHEQWLASNELIITWVNDIIDKCLENKNIENVEYKLDKEYEFYQTIKFQVIRKSGKEAIKLNFIYSEINEAIILTNEEGDIISIISIDDENIKFFEEPDGIEKIYSFYPKKHILYKSDEVYNISSQNEYGKLELNEQKFDVIISKYMKIKM